MQAELQLLELWLLNSRAIAAMLLLLLGGSLMSLLFNLNADHVLHGITQHSCQEALPG
jgi:hypothetical protein